MAVKSGFWPWKEDFGGDANGSMDSNVSTDGQRQLTKALLVGFIAGTSTWSRCGIWS